MPGGRSQAFDLAIGQGDVPALGNQNALAGQLMLDAHRSLVRTDAHGACAIEANENVFGAIADRNGMRLDLRRVDIQRNFGADDRVNRAGIERHGDRSTGLQHGKVCGTADHDLAAFDEIDARLPGLHVDIAAAAQNRFHLAADHFHGHRAVH